MKLKELLNTLAEVQQEIGTSPALICGGVPRDRVLRHIERISDIDITCGDQTIFDLAQAFAKKLQENYNVKIRTSSDNHSTIFIGNLKFDTSSNFTVPGISDILKKQNIPQPTSLQEEMFSRDFTCNALLLSLDLKNVIDPTHRGFKDIDAKMIRTCLSPAITLTSNKNRVIRAIYLAAKLNFSIDPSIIKYVSAHPETARISSEKVMSEKINQAFQYDADKTKYYLDQMKLWNFIPITEAVYPHYLNATKKGLVNAI